MPRDRFTKPLLFTIALLLAFNLVVLLLKNSTPAYAQVTGTRWEYQYISADNARPAFPTTSVLNKAGNAGWEVVFVVRGWDVLMKRRKQ